MAVEVNVNVSLSPRDGFARTRIMGAQVAVATEDRVVEAFVEAADRHEGNWTITANLDHLRKYHSEPHARSFIDAADMIVADGMPLVWASRIAGTPLPERVAGSDMLWSICQAAGARQASVFLLGGNPGVADETAAVLSKRYPGVRVAGTLCPEFGFEHDPAELEAIRAAVVTASPQIVLVGLGFPKQEVLIRHLREALPGSCYMGVGASFSFATGDVTRAPAWMQRVGLEWCFRLLCEPRRLARRYLLEGLPFALRLLGSALRYRWRGGGGGGLWGEVPSAPDARGRIRQAGR